MCEIAYFIRWFKQGSFISSYVYCRLNGGHDLAQKQIVSVGLIKYWLVMSQVKPLILTVYLPKSINVASSETRVIRFTATMGYIKSVSPLKQFHPKFTDMRLFIHAKIEVNPCLIKKNLIHTK